MTQAARAIQWAREYETIYIMRPSISADDAKKISDKVSEALSNVGAKLVAVDNWGKRKLAYPINKDTRGVFVYIRYFGFGGAVAELERNLRLSDLVIRFQTVVIKDDIDLASVDVDPEAVKFLHVESEDVEEELDAASRLGMVEVERRPRNTESEGDDDLGDSDFDDDNNDSDSDDENED
ncbi:MAG: 30S ribosomal protein S6 [Polyangiales bacterium]